MKKILFWAAVTTLAVASCNKIEEGASVGESNVPTFEASVDGADTKTIIDGFKSYWDGTEGIRVLDGKLTNGKVYTTNVEKAETATFVEKDGSVALSGDDYLAVYPESPAGSVTWDGNVANAAKKFWLLGDQKAVPGSYDPSTHIAVAYTEEGDYNLRFKNVTSLIKVNLTSDKVSEICFYGIGKEKIAGNFNVTYNNGEPTCVVNGSTILDYAKIKVSSGYLSKGVYYISVLPCTFSKGFAIEMVVDGVKATRKVSTKYELKRNQILDLGDLNLKDSGWKKTLYLEGNSNFWHQAYAKFDAWIWGGSVSGDWVDFTYLKDDLYSTIVPWDITNLNVYRRDPNAQSHDWDGNQWNSIREISLNGNNCIKITGWGTCQLTKKKDE